MFPGKIAGGAVGTRKYVGRALREATVRAEERLRGLAKRVELKRSLARLRLLHVARELRDRDRAQDSGDRHDDHDLDQGEPSRPAPPIDHVHSLRRVRPTWRIW